jgi:hypothetical protein
MDTNRKQNREWTRIDANRGKTKDEPQMAADKNGRGVMECGRCQQVLCRYLDSGSFAARYHHSATPILQYSAAVHLRQSAFICGWSSSSRPFAVNSHAVT